MKNSALDLNNHLMAQLERLGNEKLKGEELLIEIRRSDAITRVAQATTANGRLILDAAQFVEDNPQAPRLSPALAGPPATEPSVRLAPTTTGRRRR